MSQSSPASANDFAAAQVIDDATRSLSLRISVLDYGRIRVLARQLRVRESVAARLLLGAGFVGLGGLYPLTATGDAGSTHANREGFLSALTALLPLIAREGLQPERLVRALSQSPQCQALGLTTPELRARLCPTEDAPRNGATPPVAPTDTVVAQPPLPSPLEGHTQ